MNGYVALLRGVNVGGKNILPMKDLAAMFTAAGCTQVQTYIQSGNVVFRAAPGRTKLIAAEVAEQIESAFGLRVPLVMRSASQMSEVVASNPFLGESEEFLHAYFLADSPALDNVAKLDPDRSSPDRFIVREQEIFVHLPNGMARTKLTNAYFDSKLNTTSTARNWRTVKKLNTILQELPAL